MRKRILALILTVVLLSAALAVPAGAAGLTDFSDVTDQTTATAIESLRLMGVLDGYGDGTFRPANHLTRAQFCKMAVYAMDGASELGRYRTVTIFPDVKPSHWAATYINLAAKGKGVIAGYADGRFWPDRTVTVGQAVTILLRFLGYKDEEMGGVWPDSYMAVGAEIGLTDGVSNNGNAALTRAEAARLFRNLLDTEKNGGGTLYTLSKETYLQSVDGGTGEMKTGDGTYKMVNPVSSTSLVGTSGRVVLNGSGKALTFLPTTGGSSGLSNAAVVLGADRSAAGLSDLAGNTNYALYKNGLPANVNDLRKYDVATYSADTNSILVCDTRVSVYYEACKPDPDAPTSITVLGGTELRVLPTAVGSLSGFKPGQQMTLLLTADGQVAAALKNDGTTARGNAVGVVSTEGSIDLLCGTMRIPLAAAAPEAYLGQVVRISSVRKGEVTLSVLGTTASGDLNISAKTLGSKALAENVMLFEAGEQITLSQLNRGTVKAEYITAIRTNWAGDVDLIALGGGQSGDVIYGRAVVRTIPPAEGDENAVTVTTVEVLYGSKSTGALETAFDVKNGDYVAATVKNGRFTMLSALARLKDVPDSSWVGTGSVLYGGRNYEVSRSVVCYNLDSGDWVTLEEALAYGNTANLYVRDGVVHVIEVAHK